MFYREWGGSSFSTLRGGPVDGAMLVPEFCNLPTKNINENTENASFSKVKQKQFILYMKLLV